MVVAAQYASNWNAAPQPRGKDEIAKAVENRSGALNWDGPVGDGLTLAEYRAAFLKLAGPVVEFARLLNVGSRA